MVFAATRETSEFDEGGPEVSTDTSSRPAFVRLAGMFGNEEDDRFEIHT